MSAGAVRTVARLLGQLVGLVTGYVGTFGLVALLGGTLLVGGLTL